MSRGLILANFGGPRSLEEVAPFLVELLTDGDVIRTAWPRFFEKWFFRKVALRRAKKVAHDYEKIGGKSPIFEDTEKWAESLRVQLGQEVICFHRYLPGTHEDFIAQVQQSRCDKFTVLPLYPQFSFATTGSIARFFCHALPKQIADKMEWIRSYPTHPAYIAAMQRCLIDFLYQEKLQEEEVVLFFSAHGLPKKFVDEGDLYEKECQESFHLIGQAFPQAASLLAFQSKFGRGEWLRPYTSELCKAPLEWSQGRKNVVFIPLSFTSDHVETLFEMEYQYLPAIRAHGLKSFRCPALNQRPDWVAALAEIAMPNGASPTKTVSMTL
jgi:protoporphyrin/coproporphyrin ferrochelatase